MAFTVPVQDLTPSYIRLFPGMNIATVVMALLLLFWWKHEAEWTGNPAERPSFPLGPAFACFAAAGALAISQSWILGSDPLGYLIILFKDQFGFMVLTIVAFRTLARREQRWLVFATIVCIDFLVSIHSVLSYGAGVRERSSRLDRRSAESVRRLPGHADSVLGGPLRVRGTFKACSGHCRRAAPGCIAGAGLDRITRRVGGSRNRDARLRFGGEPPCHPGPARRVPADAGVLLRIQPGEASNLEPDRGPRFSARRKIRTTHLNIE